MEKQQTAVDFLRIALESKLGMRLSPSYYELFSIAKEMEEKQMIEYGRFCVQCEKQGFIIPKNK